jgi:antitoxin VapB
MAMAEEIERRAKLFKNGRSQAVRLPWEFRFAGTEVRIRKVGDVVMLEPVTPARGGFGWAGVRAEVDKMGPLDAEFGTMVDEAIRKAQEG